MTAKTMAEVLEEHIADWTTWGDEIGPGDNDYYTCICRTVRWHVNGSTDYYRAHSEHQAQALSAAGFGLVADAKAEALEEAAANIVTNDPLDYWNGHLPEGLGFQEAMSRWLKAHAKAKRAAS